jgi:hypothetical protein
VTPFRAGQAPGVQPADIAAPLTFTASTSPVNTYLADVSEFEMDVNDPVYLAWSKAMVIRAAYGDAHDDLAWYAGARRAALHKGGAKFVGIYQFLVPGQDGTAQANAFHDLVGPLQPGEVLIADFEQGTKPMLTAWYNAMLHWYPNQFLWTYTGLFFGRDQGALPVQWLADYTSVEPNEGQLLWQFTSTYNVPGVGQADCSVFHGTVDRLAALAYQPGTAVVPPPLPPPAFTPAPVGLHTALESAGSKVTFTWAGDAASYHFQLETYKGGFGWVLQLDEQVLTRSVDTVLPPSTQFRWRVAAGTSGYIWTDWVVLTTP